MKYKFSKPVVYSDVRVCMHGCCTTAVTGIKKILQEQDGGSSCIVQEFYKNTHGFGSSIRGYNLHFKEPIVISNALQRMGESSEEFVLRMREELRQCARQTAITTWEQTQLKSQYGTIPPRYRWGIRDGRP